MREHEAGPGVAALRCRHCGSEEPLPADARERVFVLRALAAGRPWETDPLRGPLVSMLGTFEGSAFRPTFASLAFVAVVVIAGTVHRLAASDPLAILGRSAVPGLSASELRDLQWSTAFTLVFPTALVLGVALGFVLAVARVRSLLRRELAPLVLATPSDSPATPSRCRRCGGDLPGPARALVDCSYCQATNVVAEDEVARTLAARMRQEGVMRPSEAAERLARIQEEASARMRVSAFVGFAGVLVASGLGSYLLLVSASR